jgi:hypothetical protein
MGKWSVALPPAGGWVWKAMADLLKWDLPDDDVYLWQGPFSIALIGDPVPAPVLAVAEAGNDWRYR